MKVLIKDQLKEMQSVKVKLLLWVRCKKKSVRLVITLGPEDIEDAQDVGGNTGDN